MKFKYRNNILIIIMTRIFSFEGNIGSGKSTLVTAFQEYYSDENKCNGLKICFVQEPVDEWNTITDEAGKTVIECFYADNKRYAFAFQMMAYISRLTILKKELTKGYDIIFTERCLFTDRNVFAKMLYDEGKINEIEYKIYNKWFDEFIKDFPKVEYIYLKTNPQTTFDRIIKRGRPGEIIPLEYLTKCHEYHEHWLSNHVKDNYTLECDTDTSGPDGQNIIMSWINKIDLNIPTYTLKFDGASRGNPGLCGAGYVIYKKNDNQIIHQGNLFIAESNTNNFAEYSAVIIGLQKCIELNIKSVNILGDSQLVIKQLQKEYKVSSENLQTSYHKVNSLLEKLDKYNLEHILRSENKEADKLANEAIDNYIANSIGAWQHA